MDNIPLQESCNRIDTAVIELNNLTQGVNSREGGYVVTVINTLIILLQSTGSALDGRARMARFKNIESYRAHLNLVNRIFISLIHSAIEMGVDSIIEDKKITVESQYQKELNDLILSASCACKDKKMAIKNLKNEAKKITPNLNDKIRLLTQPMHDEGVREFRRFFESLSILRNKCSHPDGELSQSDIKKIKKSIFKNLITEDNLFVLSPVYYAKICQYALMFINLIPFGLGKPR